MAEKTNSSNIFVSGAYGLSLTYVAFEIYIFFIYSPLEWINSWSRFSFRFVIAAEFSIGVIYSIISKLFGKLWHILSMWALYTSSCWQYIYVKMRPVTSFSFLFLRVYIKNACLFIAHLRMRSTFVIPFCIVGHLGIAEICNPSKSKPKYQNWVIWVV